MLGEMVQSQSGSLLEEQEPYRKKTKGQWTYAPAEQHRGRLAESALHIRRGVHGKLNTLLTCPLFKLHGAEQEKHGCSEH